MVGVMTQKHFLLFYDYAPDYLARRSELRAAHFNSAKGALERGELVLAGAFANPADGAVFLWKCEDETPIRAFVEADPYNRNGLVAGWRIREWTTVAGKDALTPFKPPQ
jgi:uncharacterized protein YciI